MEVYCFKDGKSVDDLYGAVEAASVGLMRKRGSLYIEPMFRIYASSLIPMVPGLAGIVPQELRDSVRMCFPGKPANFQGEIIKFRTMRTRELPEDAIAAAERLIDCDYYGFIGTHPLEACVLARYDYPNQKPPVWYVPGRVNGYLGQSGLDPEHADSRNPIPVELSFATEGRFLWEEAANSEQKHIARRVLEELGNPIRKLP